MYNTSGRVDQLEPLTRYAHAHNQCNTMESNLCREPIRGRKAKEKPENCDHSDSDDAPEDISLSRGREEALETRRVASRESKRAILLLKERRKKREELFTSQKNAKKQKRVENDLMRFPVTDLKRVLEIDDHQGIEQIGSLSKKAESKAKKRRKVTKQETAMECQYDSVKVVALEDTGGVRPVAAGHDTASNFFHEQLYKNPRIKRIPVLSFEAQKYNNRPAANFV